MKRARMQLAGYSVALAMLATACLGADEAAVVVETTPSIAAPLELDTPELGREVTGGEELPQGSPLDDLAGSPPQADDWFPELPADAVADAYTAARAKANSAAPTAPLTTQPPTTLA
ncbi:MAG: hypothetical protein HKN26_00425, partial [Acidimicrobiales bacterium]|nr:hypothetical protein [Acidimicrobiales bacterium]